MNGLHQRNPLFTNQVQLKEFITYYFISTRYQFCFNREKVAITQFLYTDIAKLKSTQYDSML